MTNKVYTIIDFFSLDGHIEPDQCWVANFADKEDAKSAFESKLNETSAIGSDGKVVIDAKGKKSTPCELFESLLNSGVCFEFCNGSQYDKWFIRGEEIQTNFDAERISWN